MRDILSPGRHQLEISLVKEADSFTRKIGPGFVGLKDSLEMSLDCVTYTFEPAAQASASLYWGYLVRIINFKLRIGSDALEYDDSSDEIWSEEQVVAQGRLGERVLSLMSA